MKANSQKWQLQSSRKLVDHPRIKVREDTLLLPDGKTIDYVWQPYSGEGGVVIVCLRDDEVLLQKEYSYPVDEIIWQLPGGKIEAGETPEEAACRELAEESGITARSMKKLGKFYPDNRKTSAVLHVMLASHFEKYSLPADDGELIESHWLDVSEVTHMIQSGEIKNYAMLAAWTFILLNTECLRFE